MTEELDWLHGAVQKKPPVHFHIEIVGNAFEATATVSIAGLDSDPFLPGYTCGSAWKRLRGF